jgi:hypothetical protein
VPDSGNWCEKAAKTGQICVEKKSKSVEDELFEDTASGQMMQDLAVA